MNNPHLMQTPLWVGTSKTLGVIALHGRGQSPELMLEFLGDALTDNVCAIIPRAAQGSWYSRRFMEAGVENDEAVARALDAVAWASGELSARGISTSRQVLVGFSQGGCLACEYVWRRRAKLGALAALTGGLLGAEGTRWEAPDVSFAGMPVHIGGSVDDEWVPSSRMRETAAVFEKTGARVDTWFRPGAEHSVPPEQRALLRKVILDVEAT